MLSLHDSLLDHAIALGVEGDGAHGRPVAGVSRPARRVAFARGGVKPMARGQDRHVRAGMALPWADVTQAAMTVGVIVPSHEGAGPRARGVEVGEAVARELGPVLGHAEQRFDEGVVVADAGARVRRLDAQPVRRLPCQVDRLKLESSWF